MAYALCRSIYYPPSWIDGTEGERKLAVIPKCKVELSMKNTPVHEWNIPQLPEGFQVCIKREDLTGSILSGNKVRKLEFLIGDALDKGCDCLITCGGLQSNHARATALAGKQFGLDTHMLLIDKEDQYPPQVDFKGNLLLSRLVGATIIICPPLIMKDLSNIIERQIDMMEQYAVELRKEGRKPYIIPGGGFSTVGSWGYIDAWDEMMKQGILEMFDDIFLAAGSTGTACGLAVANYLTGSKLKIHGVSIGIPVDSCYKLVDDHLSALGLVATSACDILDIVDGYIGLGYGQSTPQELGLIADVMFKTGLSLDPTFTAKALLGMITEMKLNPTRFQGNRVLFIHTGGVFSLFDGTIDEEVLKIPHCNKIKHFSDVLPNYTW